MSQHTIPRPPVAGPRPGPPPRRRRPGRSIIDQRQTPWGWIAAVIAVSGLVTVIVIAVVAGRDHTSSREKANSSTGPGAAVQSEIMPAAVTGKPVTDVAAQRVTDTSGIPGVLAWNTTGWPGDGTSPAGAVQHQHVTGPVTYAVTPPIGGPHNSTWLNAGIYDKPVPSERAVHDMEHGAVWITYDPNLSAADVAALRAFVLRQDMLPEHTETATTSSRYIVMSPWASNSLPTPIVISSWGHQLRANSPADARLQRFVDTFRSSQRYTPEFGEQVDGVPAAIGGRPTA